MLREAVSRKMDGERWKFRLRESLKNPGSRSGMGAGDSTSPSGKSGPGDGISNPENRPIEPGDSKGSRIRFFRWLFIFFALVYVLVSAYHAPILTQIGRYLVVEQPPDRSDLIVCLAGGNVERGLSAADAFHRGLAPKIFVARELIPDGSDILRRRGVTYPESRDLLVGLLRGLGVPESAILTSDTPSANTLTDAAIILNTLKEKHYRSILLVTSPTHSRRAWLVFRKTMGGDGVRIQVISSSYSSFKAETWWKDPRYVREVILEYQKLIYYFLKGYI
jgi:uncharacterized SAM-binding protein YcdF (DUF218 family)